MNTSQTEMGSTSQDCCWQLLNPLPKLNECMSLCSPGQGEQWRIGLFDQISNPVPLTSLKGMQNGRGRLVMLGIPTAGTSMQYGYQMGIGLLQQGGQGLGK